jgi:PhzF family phenazine biosynthesis protein
MKTFIVRAFVRDNKGGNPAGVVLDAEMLSHTQKQGIASKIGLSETAFVSLDTEADFFLEFFTPTRQIANCGHATLGSFGLMKQLGRLDRNHFTIRTETGKNEIWVNSNKVMMEQRKPNFEIVPIESVLPSLGLTLEEVIIPATIVNTGNSFLIIQLRNESTLSSIRPDMKQIEQLSESYDLIGYYLFVRTEGEKDSVARMFGPRYGIIEESATGMAAGPLACFLHTLRQDTRKRFIIHQGDYMNVPSPSRLEVELNIIGEQISNLFVSGQISVEKELNLG